MRYPYESIFSQALYLEFYGENQYQSHPRTHQRYRESTKPLVASLEKLRLDAVSTALVEKFKLSSSDQMSLGSPARLLGTSEPQRNRKGDDPLV